MTAEVAVLNKHGIAMAADSAITSGRDGVQKVYHTANKLFSLSKEHPIGIMIYGSASFMEVPWEVIIKTYRESLGTKPFAKVEDYLEDFFRFLNEDGRFNDRQVEEIIVYRLFSDELKAIVKEVEERMATQETMEEGISSERVSTWFSECVDREIAYFEKEEKSLLTIDKQAFLDKFSSVLNEVKEELIRYEIPDELSKKLDKLAHHLVEKDYFSKGSTGIVIGGYGEETIFPQLLNYRLEGFVLGQLKYKQLKNKQISYTSDKWDGTSSITAFAQREMVDAFVSGIEPNMKDIIFQMVANVLRRYREQVGDALSLTLTDEQMKNLEKMGKEAYAAMEEALEEYQDNTYVEPLLGVVRALPKEELADMAEALVSLTTFKRRVTRVTESVGPPIDVAIITRGDGFIWMKRKSYVNKEINTNL